MEADSRSHGGRQPVTWRQTTCHIEADSRSHGGRHPVTLRQTAGHMEADGQSPDCQLVLNRRATLCSQVQDKEDGGRQMVEAGKGEALHGVAL